MYKVNNKPFVKLNLQMFNDDFFGPDGPPSDIENPLTSDVKVDETPAVEDKKVDTVTDTDVVSDNQTDKPKDIEINFDDIRTKLDDILNNMKHDKSTETDTKVVDEKPELTPEQIEEINNEFYLKFSEKPLETLQELIEEKANEKVKPLMEYVNQLKAVDEWNKTIDEFGKKNPDFKDYVNDVANIIQNDEGIRTSKNPLEVAYKLAKAEKLQAELEQKNKPIDELVKDEKTLKSLLSNPEIKNMIVKELMGSKEQIPTVVGGGGSTTVNVADRPKTIEEATKAWLGK